MSDHAAFTGDLPRNYDHGLGPMYFEPYARDLAARIEPRDGLRVLELAAGTGIVTRVLRDQLPGARIVATDLNDAMLDYARDAVGGDRIEWRQADAQALPFDDGSFDVVVCQYGLMFLPDKVQGYREARRVLAPGGVFLANVWHAIERVPPAAIAERVLRELFPDDPPTFLHVPYGYDDPDRIRAEMAEAGWTNVTLEDVHLEGSGRTAHEFAGGFTRGSPLAHDLTARNADVELVTTALAAAYAAELGDPPTVPMGAIVITARA